MTVWGAWRSWLAHFLDMEGVIGSSPIAPTIYNSVKRQDEKRPYTQNNIKQVVL